MQTVSAREMSDSNRHTTLYVSAQVGLMLQFVLRAQNFIRLVSIALRAVGDKWPEVARLDLHMVSWGKRSPLSGLQQRLAAIIYI